MHFTYKFRSYRAVRALDVNKRADRNEGRYLSHKTRAVHYFTAIL